MDQTLVTIISIISIILLLAIVGIIFIKKPTKLGKSILWFMIPIFIIGCVIHGMAIFYANPEYPWYYTILYSIVSGFRMFGFYLSSSVLEGLVVANFYYAIAVTLNYVIASMNTILVFLVFIFSSFRNEILTLIYKQKKHYIVLGSNKDAVLLALDIRESTKDNVIVIMDKNNELIRMTKKYEKKGVAFIFGYNKEKLLTKAGISKDNSIIISIEETDEMNLNNAILISEKIKENSNAYISYSNIPNVKYLKICENKNIRFFSKEELIGEEFISSYRLFKMLGKDRIDFQRNTIKCEMKHVFLGFNSVSENILLQLILNYQLIDKKFESVVYTKDHKKDEQKFHSIYYAYNDINKLIESDNKKTDEEKEYLDLENIKMNLVFKKDEYDSYDFKVDILKEVEDYSFIYIDYGEDRINFDRAINLNDYLQTHEYNNFHIFVRMRNPEKYNASKVFPENISYYGEDRSVLSKRLIIDEKLDLLAKDINYFYAKQYADGKTITMEEAWRVLSYIKKESNRCAATSMIAKLNLMGLDITLDKDKTPITEKEYLLIYNKGKELIRKIDINIDTYKYDVCRINLGILEHLRWNTFQIINNYYPMKKKDIFADNKYHRVDDKRKTHANLASIKGILDLERIIKDADFLSENERENMSQIFVKDFDMMDRIFEIIEDSGFIIYKLY